MKKAENNCSISSQTFQNLKDKNTDVKYGKFAKLCDFVATYFY